MIVNDETTWPIKLVTCLEKYYDTLLAWEQRHVGETPHVDLSAPVYDEAIHAILKALHAESLVGFHCTRLTEAEIESILEIGLTPQNGEKLGKRIDALATTGQLSTELAHRLKAENQADDRNRAEMIWFCFYPPHKAGQRGLERFFRYWGGEALYNSHEDDPETGPVLARIGTPCLIEADVPVGTDKHSWLPVKLARIFLANRGFQTRESVDHESYSTIPIHPANIRRVICHPGTEFMKLTGAAKWKPSLS